MVNANVHDWAEHGSKEWPLCLILLFFFVALQKKQLLCPAAEFVLRDYTVSLSGTWQGFVVSHTFLDNMADLLIWHSVPPLSPDHWQNPDIKKTASQCEGDSRWKRETIHTRREKKPGMNPPDRWCMHDRWAMQGNTFYTGRKLRQTWTRPLHWSDKPCV